MGSRCVAFTSIPSSVLVAYNSRIRYADPLILPRLRAPKSTSDVPRVRRVHGVAFVGTFFSSSIPRSLAWDMLPEPRTSNPTKTMSSCVFVCSTSYPRGPCSTATPCPGFQRKTRRRGSQYHNEVQIYPWRLSHYFVSCRGISLFRVSRRDIYGGGPFILELLTLHCAHGPT